MLRVKAKIGKSNIHGWGLFADQFIKAGTVTWKYDSSMDMCLTKEEIDNLPEINREYMYKYAYFDAELNKFVLCADDQRYINHSEKKELINIASTPRQDVASTDIQPGDEFLCDYFMFDSDYFARHGMSRQELI